MNLDPDLYKNHLTPAQVDARLKKAINFSKVSGSMDRKAKSFEHFQGIVPKYLFQVLTKQRLYMDTIKRSYLSVMELETIIKILILMYL